MDSANTNYETQNNTLLIFNYTHILSYPLHRTAPHRPPHVHSIPLQVTQRSSKYVMVGILYTWYTCEEIPAVGTSQHRRPVWFYPYGNDYHTHTHTYPNGKDKKLESSLVKSRKSWVYHFMIFIFRCFHLPFLFLHKSRVHLLWERLGPNKWLNVTLLGKAN